MSDYVIYTVKEIEKQIKTNDRYIIVEGSTTAHCCFQYSVIDLTQKEMLSNPVCECYDLTRAVQITVSLNSNNQ